MVAFSKKPSEDLREALSRTWTALGSVDETLDGHHFTVPQPVASIEGLDR